MTMANKKEECEEFATCLCLKFGAPSSIVGLFIVLEMNMAVMAISFTLRFHSFMSLRVAESSRLIKIYFEKLLNCDFNNRNY